MVMRTVTGAHYGLRDWLFQRISAVVMLVYFLLLAGWLWQHPQPDYAQWTALFSSNVMRSLTLLFLLALFGHAWIGMRNVVMDYIKSAKLRLLIHVVVINLLILYTIWSVQILWEF